NPIHMRMRKLRGPHMKKSMPFEPFRTQTQPVNLADLEARFDAGAEVTPQGLRERGLAKRKDVPVKILARGELSKALTVHAGGLQRIAIFALGLMPYITASIILQLLTVVVPSLEKLQKEGEVGQARITQYTRYLTVGLAFAQSIGYVFLFRSFGSSAGSQII